MSLTKEQKIQMAHKVWSRDIEAFGDFFFPHHLRKKTPVFHREIYKLYEDDSLDRIAIVAPRGFSKSTITDLVYLAWAIVNKKAHFILLTSDTYSQAVLFLDAVKAEFEGNDKLKAHYGDLTSNNWSEGEIVVNGIMIKALGAGMKVRGLKYREYRPDLVIIDDLENDELVQSKERREKLERWFNATLVPSLAEGGRIVIIGTILHYDALLTKISSEKNYSEYTKRIYRAIMDGKSLWKEHKTLEQIDKLKKEYLEKGQGYLFYQEYMNDPVSGDNQKFKIEKFKYYTEEEIEKKSLTTFLTIDRAYSTQKTADFTAFIVVSVDRENNWYIRQAERFKGNEYEVRDKIFDVQAYWKPQRVAMEQKAFKYTFKVVMDEEMRKRNKFFAIDELKDGGKSKNMRIEALVPRFLSGGMYFKKDQLDLIDEMLTFPSGVHDDLVDALAYQMGIARPGNRTNPFSNNNKTLFR